MLLVVLVWSLVLSVRGQQAEDDWIDPYDMLNYDASTKTMRKPAETANYPNVPTKRREYNHDSNQAEQTRCDSQVKDLQRQVEQLKKKITSLSQQPTCNPVFKRFLSRLLKEIQRVRLPSDSADILYDAKIKLSSQAMAEIQTLLEGEDSWRTGALDNAISQILVDLRPHDYEAWRWRFEDTFGVELDTLLKMGLCVLLLIGIICTQLWSTVSRFMQFRRMLFVGFIVSIFWNWLYLYKIEFAKHQNNLVKANSDYEKCTGMKSIDWRDSLKEWYRSTWTLQDDPCKKYYEVLMVDPLLLVPPTKAFAVTITTFITEPLKHVGEGISDFLRALLKDLPVTLQIPVLLTIVLSIVVFMYGSVHAAFQHGIAAPFRRPRRDPPPQLEPRRHLQEIADGDHLAGGDADQPAPRYRADDDRLHRNQVHQRRPNRPREQRTKVVVETLRRELPNSEDETDTRQHEDEQNLSAESDPETLQDANEELAGAGAGATEVTANTHEAEDQSLDLDIPNFKNKPLKENKKPPDDEPSRDTEASQPEMAETAHTDVQDQQAAEGKNPMAHMENVGLPVQESSPALAE